MRTLYSTLFFQFARYTVDCMAGPAIAWHITHRFRACQGGIDAIRQHEETLWEQEVCVTSFQKNPEWFYTFLQFFNNQQFIAGDF